MMFARNFISKNAVAQGAGAPSRARVVALALSARNFSTNKKSSGDDLVLTSIDTSTGVATVTLNRPPVNSLSLEMFQAISSSIKQAEADSLIHALVLKSAKPSVFSAGLDLMEMHKPDDGRLREFWTSFQQVYLDLYGSRLACIAAIEGAAPAAGCMLALSCDYRIMSASTESSRPPTIGLNESRLGIVAPPFLARQFMDTVGRRQAELGLSLGTLYSPEEAKAIGLVDQVVPADQVLETANRTAMEWARVPPTARVNSKMLVRGDALDELERTRQQDVDEFVSFITSDEAQGGLSAYLAMMAQKRKK